MMKLLTIISICLLILLTALVKNSTKKLEDEIFVKQENLRSLNKEFQNTKLEYDYLSSSTRLMEFQKNYFEDQLVKKEIYEIMVIDFDKDELSLKKFKFNE